MEETNAATPSPDAAAAVIIETEGTGEETPPAGPGEPEVEKEDLSQIPFLKRLGKKQFWGNVGQVIKKTTTNGVNSAAKGLKSLGKKETWVGEKGAFGKETWRPVGENMKTGFSKMKDKETWIGEKGAFGKETWIGKKGAFGKETWAGETGVFGSNNRAKAKALVQKVGSKLKKKSKDDEEDEEARADREEKERVALTMLKEGQISQEEYDQILAETVTADAATEEAAAAATEAPEPVITLDGAAIAASATTIEPIVDGRDTVDTADL